MKQEQLELHETVERYLRDELGADESARFEQRLIWDTEIQDQLELSQRLRDGLRDSEASVSNPQANSIRKFFLSPQYAAAASFLFVAMAVGWLGSWLGSSGGADGLAQVSSARVFSLEATRSTEPESLPIVSPGESKDWITLLIYPDIENISQVRINLARRSDGQAEDWRRVWQGAPTKTAGDTVAVSVQSKILRPGIYRLQIVEWRNQPGQIADEVTFRVPGNWTDSR